MKSMKKLVTLLLSLVMLCALAMPAMAEGEDADKKYSITINNAVAGHTYTAYQVFDGAYYKGDGTNNTTDGTEYLSDVKWGKDVDGDKILKELHENALLKDSFEKKTSAEDVAYVLQGFNDKSQQMDEFARVVSHHLSTTENSGTVTIQQDGTNNKITPLAAGYYFVKDSGTINDGEIATKFLVEVVGDAKVTVKAQAPEFKKEIVKDNATDNNKGTSVNVGDKVTFRLTAKVPDMASFDEYTFTIHDTLSNGLTFDSTSVKVTANNNNTPVATDKYTLNYTEGAQNFTIAFTKAQLKDLVSHTDNDATFGATIVVEYNATLNKNALQTDKENNTAYLVYTNDPSNTGAGNTKKTPDAPVYVYDFDIEIAKYDGTNGDTDADKAKKLSNATFVLYKIDGETVKYYVRNKDTMAVTWDEELNNATPLTTVEGKTTFTGLKEGTYYLKETQAPAGYNTLKKDVEVKITATYKENGELENHSATSTDNGQYIQVESIANKAGAVLPSTGGIGTTIFYVLGSILALGAAVLLIAKKRMNGQDR